MTNNEKAAEKAVKERPILFSGPMVRALLDGSKTQTRRVVKPQPVRVEDSSILQWRGGLFQPERLPANSNMLKHCPYGQPGDRLWVRETCIGWETHEGRDGVWYVADGTFRPIENTREAADQWLVLRTYRGERGAQGPGIHMPRWASRILVEIVSVRVERLRDISEADSLAEGIQQRPVRCRDARLAGQTVYGIGDENDWANTARQAYEHLWEQINGPGSWDANPFVWVVSFNRVD